MGSPNLTIDENTGEISVSSEFDFEVTLYHHFIVVARDGIAESSSILSAMTMVQITVLNINEVPPNFNPVSYSQNISEDTLTGASILTVAATDGDDFIDGEFYFTITEDVPFRVHPTTGLLSLVGSLDYETDQRYTFDVLAIDYGINPQAKTGSAEVSITITDVNDNSPQCSIALVNKGEDTLVGTSLLNSTCTDNDGSNNSDLAYSLISGDSMNKFMVDSSTGEISLGNMLDFETDVAYHLRIQVTDGLLTGIGEVFIDVSGINEHSPVVSNIINTISVPEDTHVGVNIYNVAASDGDDLSTPDGQITFSFVNGNSLGHFLLQENMVRLSSPLDRETLSGYNLTIQARDGASPPKETLFTLLIEVTDIDDNLPYFVPPVYLATLAESSIVESVVQTVTSQDGDGQIDDDCKYNITIGNTDDRFAVNNCSIVLTSNLDYETVKVYTIGISILTSDFPLGNQALLLVQVEAVNEFPPVIQDQQIVLNEDIEIGSPVAIVMASDSDDGENGHIYYFIESQDIGNTFDIETTNGTGKVFLRETLDFEQSPNKLLVLAVRDNPTSLNYMNDTVLIEFSIKNVNDNWPDISNIPTSLTRYEDSPPGVVATFIATDQDDNNGVLFSLVDSSGSEMFIINSATGELNLNRSLDYEERNNYKLHILVADRGNQALSSEVEINVAVLDVNDYEPQFEMGEHATSVSENSPPTNIKPMTAVDRDGTSPNNQMTYSFGPEATPNFYINEVTGLVSTTRSLDREVNNT